MSHSLAAPLCQPEELANSAIGRAAVLSGVTATQLVRELTRNHSTIAGTPRAFYAMASHFGLSNYRLLRRHTLIPFFGRAKCAFTVDEQRHTYKWASQLLTTGSISYGICPDCVDEDIQWHGFSYWRRSHALPGMAMCLKHRCRLKRSLISPLDGSPEQALENASTEIDIDDTYGSELTTRYMNVSNELLTANAWPCGDVILNRLTRKAEQLGICAGCVSEVRRPDAPKLSDYAMAIGEEKAALTLLSSISNVKADDPRHALDGTLILNNPSMQRLCLIACLLTDDTDGALALLATQSSRDEFARTSHLGKSEENDLFRKYCEARGDHEITAELTHWNTWSVSDTLDRMGLPDMANYNNYAALKVLMELTKGGYMKDACQKHSAKSEIVGPLLRQTNPLLFEFAEHMTKDEMTRTQNRRHSQH